MAPPNPVVSPDGAYYWDGQAWKPMPAQAGSAPVAPAEPERPSWLPAETPAPAAPPQAAAPAAQPAPPPDAYAPSPPAQAPLWAAPGPPANDSRTMVMAAAGVILVLLVGVAGYTVYQATRSDSGAVNTAATSTSTPSSELSPTPRATVVAQQPLTANLGGEYCPVAHVNNTACWHGTLVDTGGKIGKLAMIFVSGGGYTNWFTTHTNPALSGFYTSPGCDLDVANSQMVCGAVQKGDEVSVYLIGDTSKRGTYRYAVKFADISSGTPVYVDQNPDGTHQIVSWTEVIT